MVEVRVPQPAEYEAFLQAMGVTFSFEPNEFSRDLLENLVGPDRLLAAFDDDQPVATYGSFPFTMQVPGGTAQTSGVTIIAVSATHRRLGILTTMMEQDLLAARDRGDIVASLWASEAGIYSRFGFGPSATSTAWELKRAGAKLASPIDTRGRVRFVDEATARETLPAIYREAMAGVPGANSRTANWWHSRIIADEPERRRGRPPKRIAVLNLGAKDVGYVIYRTKPDGEPFTLTIAELIGINDEAQKSLWQFVFDVDLVSEIKAPLQPHRDPLQGWLVDPRSLVTTTVRDSVWTRLVDLKAGLEARQYRTDGELVFTINDPQCSWNTGTWKLSIDQGSATASPTTASSEVVLTPSGLGSLYLGGASAVALASEGEISGPANAIAKVDLLFGWHIAPWCPEVF